MCPCELHVAATVRRFTKAHTCGAAVVLIVVVVVVSFVCSIVVVVKAVVDVVSLLFEPETSPDDACDKDAERSTPLSQPTRAVNNNNIANIKVTIVFISNAPFFFARTDFVIKSISHHFACCQ